MSVNTIAAAASFTPKWKWALTPGWDCEAEHGLLQRSLAWRNTAFNQSRGHCTNTGYHFSLMTKGILWINKKWYFYQLVNRVVFFNSFIHFLLFVIGGVFNRFCGATSRTCDLYKLENTAFIFPFLSQWTEHFQQYWIVGFYFFSPNVFIKMC